MNLVRTYVPATRLRCSSLLQVIVNEENSHDTKDNIERRLTNCQEPAQFQGARGSRSHHRYYCIVGGTLGNDLNLS